MYLTTPVEWTTIAAATRTKCKGATPWVRGYQLVTDHTVHKEINTHQIKLHHFGGRGTVKCIRPSKVATGHKLSAIPGRKRSHLLQENAGTISSEKHPERD